MIGTNRFRLKFYFLLTALILLTMLTSLSLSYYFSYDNQLKQLESQIKQTVEDKAGFMGEWLSGKIALMDVACASVDNSPGLLLSADLLKQNGISDIYEGFENGQFNSYTGWKAPIGYDPRVRPWYITIRNNNKLTISDPYLDLNSKEMAVSVGRPVSKNGKLIGIRAADILITTIVAKVSQLDFAELGFVWIINERGNFIYHPDTNILYKNISAINSLTGIPDFKTLKDSGEIHYKYNDSKRTALFRKIPNSEWLLGVTVLEEHAFENLERLKSLYLVLSIVLSCIFGATSIFLTRILAAPIIRIINFVEGISRGNLDQTLELHFNKEIDKLADSLNDMALTLKTNFEQIEDQKQALSVYNSELERLVQERTKDIEIANQKLKESYETMEKQASTDFLTGISNRRCFFDMATREVSRSNRDAHYFCLLVADLDDFKHVNDQFGHSAGDMVLIEAVQSIKSCLRSYDLFGRLGGEEFIILLPDTSETHGFEIGERIRKRVYENTVIYDNQSIRVSVSIGLTYKDSKDVSLEVAISRADEALYAAKRTGKNKVAVYTLPEE